MSARLRPPFVRVVTFAAIASALGCDDGVLFYGAEAGADASDALDALEAGDEPEVGDARDATATARPRPTPGPHKPRPLEQTVGKACDDDEQCSPARSGANFCSNDGSFAYGTLYPTPVCLGRSCDPVPGQPITRCDADHGLCVENTTLASVCLPVCTFDGSGAAPRGCLGHDACVAVGVEGGVGVGYCLGGCTRDEDCVLGDVCQRDLGYCVKHLFERTMDVGVACTAGTNPPEVECNCLFPAPVSGLGYCTQFCLVGDARAACPSGMRCSAQIPASLGVEPPGMAGNCLHTCTTDDQCAPFNAHCDDTLAGGAVCVPGERQSP